MSALQAILSFLVTVIALASLIALVYGAIHASIVAIGRNPLAKGAIYKTLLQVIGMALLIVIVAVAILYLTLR